MERAMTLSAGSLVPAVLLNLLQDSNTGSRTTNAGFLSAMAAGLEHRVWQATSDLTTGNLTVVATNVIKVVDTGADPMTLINGTIDWSDRIFLGVYRPMGGASQRPGDGDDIHFGNGTLTTWCDYLGGPGLDAGSAAPAAGSPPVRASGTSWAIQLVTNLWLYIDPSDGSLKLYNDTGSTIRSPFLWFFATGDMGKL